MEEGIWRHEPRWTAAEKTVAHRAFELAYQRQCSTILAEVRRMVEGASTPPDLWKLHDYLSDHRKMTDEMYDYRYSVLLTVFARLLNEGWLNEAELTGLEKDKIEEIKRRAAY